MADPKDERIAELEDELAAAQRTVEVLIARLERSSSAPATQAELFDTAVRLGNVLEERTKEVEAARAEFRALRANLDQIVKQRTRALAESEAQLRAKNVELERQSRIRTEFISIAAHELRTPLMALRLNLLSVERALESAANAVAEPSSTLVGRRIESGLHHTERLAHLIERLLDLPRIASGQFQLKLEELDLAALAREAVDAYRETALRAGSQLRFDGAESAVGSFDRSRMQEALENLLSNAIKYGEGRPIEVSVEPFEATVRMVVADHGAGIAPEDLDKIFERFQRGAATRHQPGLGLGLYVTRHIIAAHGGTIAASSTVGSGTTFTVELPRVSANAALGEPAVPRQAM